MKQTRVILMWPTLAEQTDKLHKSERLRAPEQSRFREIILHKPFTAHTIPSTARAAILMRSKCRACS
jgi:hypothetical protein